MKLITRFTFSLKYNYGIYYFTDVARTVDDGSGLRQALSAVKDGNGRGPCTSLPVVDVRSFVNTWLIS